MKEYKYEYIDNDIQYIGFDFKEGPVDAQYVKSQNPKYRGNPFIEALPKPLTTEECAVFYTKYIDLGNIATERSLPRSERLQYVNNLYDLRFPLPFISRLELAFHNALVDSYSKRYLVTDKGADLSKYYPGTLVGTNSKMFGDETEASVVGFGLIGFSGCGKTSALKLLLSRYPKMIYHYCVLGPFIQVPYLVVNCAANSNFKSLYASIGAALDKTLGNLDCVYETIIKKKKSLADKADYVRQLVETFAIGIIIFDEIQLLDFKSTKENSYDSLLILNNKTKVALASIGTEEAHDLMFAKYRTARRIGPVIRADDYCSNEKFFNEIFSVLSKYQWFDERIRFDENFKKHLFIRSGGVIENIIKIYANILYEYLDNKKINTVNEKSIDEVIEKYFDGTDRALRRTRRSVANRKKIEEKEDQMDLEEELIHAKKEAEELRDQIEQKEMIDKYVAEETKVICDTADRLMRNIISNVKKRFPDLSAEFISNQFVTIYKNKKAQSLSEKEFTNLIIKSIETRMLEADRKTKKVIERPFDKVPIETMRKQLESMC